MKYALEDLVQYGRKLLSPCLRLGDNRIELDVDYKVILMSNYVSSRVIELTGKSLEIGFMYGGTVQRSGHQMRLRVDAMYVPPVQRIHGASFDSSPAVTSDAAAHFSAMCKRIVGIGHSHANFDVFHSSADYANYQNQVGVIGVKVDSAPLVVPAVAQSFSSRLNRSFTYHQPRKSSFSYILPSFVFNGQGEYLDAKIAIRSYLEEPDGRMTSQFNVQDCNLRIYNKQAVLTDSDKRMLDYAVMRVISHNGFDVGKVNKERITAPLPCPIPSS